MNEVEKTNLNKIEVEITILKHQTAQNIIEIGKRLIKAKELVPHGEWGKWLDKRVEFTDRTARNFMRVAREFPNRNAIADLGQSKVFALLSLPEEKREEFIKENPVEDMTTRELQKAIKEKKELEKQVKELKNQEPKVIEKEVEKIVEVIPKDYKHLKNKKIELEEELDSLKQKLKYQVSSDDYDRLRKEYSAKAGEASDLKRQIKALVKADSKTKHREKLKDSALMFCTRVHTFLSDVGGLAWLTEYIDELDDYDRKSYIKALDLIEGWILTVKYNINEEEK